MVHVSGTVADSWGGRFTPAVCAEACAVLGPLGITPFQRMCRIIWSLILPSTMKRARSTAKKLLRLVLCARWGRSLERSPFLTRSDVGAASANALDSQALPEPRRYQSRRRR